MTIDINTIFNLILTAALSYITWSFKDRDEKKERRIECVENEVKSIRQNASDDVQAVRKEVSEDVKVIRKEAADKETQYYKEFVTKEQHDMDINSILQKLDNINDTTREIYKDIGTLIGRSQKDGK